MAVAVDPIAKTRPWVEQEGYSMTFLSDPGAREIRRLGLLHPGAGIAGSDIARPAEFLLDRDGIVRWRNLTDDYRVRLDADRLLEVLERLARDQENIRK